MDIHAFVGIPVRFFRSIGLVPFHVPNRPVPAIPIWLQLHLITSIFMLGVCIVGEAVHFFKVVAQPEYFVQACAVFLYFGFNMLSYAKMFTVLRSRPQLSRLMTELDEMFPRTLADREDCRVEHHVAVAMRMIRSYSVFQMMMIWFFNLFPTVEALMSVWQHGEWRLDFPYENWYPIEAYDRGWFELCYLSQFWGSYTSASGALATDLLLCSMAAQVGMHFDRLSRRLRRMRPQGGRKEREEFAELRDCVRTHGRIIGLSKMLDDIFDICILFNVMSSVCIICMLGFLVTTSTESTALVKFAMALFTCAVQVLLISVFGDQFTESSVGVADAAWEGEWFNGSPRFKDGILLLMQRAQRPQYLTAYKYTVVSMVMFSNVMSTSWQFFVLISSVYDE